MYTLTTPTHTHIYHRLTNQFSKLNEPKVKKNLPTAMEKTSHQQTNQTPPPHPVTKPMMHKAATPPPPPPKQIVFSFNFFFCTLFFFSWSLKRSKFFSPPLFFVVLFFFFILLCWHCFMNLAPIYLLNKNFFLCFTISLFFFSLSLYPSSSGF